MKRALTHSSYMGLAIKLGLILYGSEASYMYTCKFSNNNYTSLP